MFMGLYDSIYGVMRHLMRWLKAKRIVSFNPESRLSTSSWEKSGKNANNLLSPILNSYQELDLPRRLLSIIMGKPKCCQDNKVVYCCCPTSATMPMTPIQRPSVPIKPRKLLTYHQVGSWKLSHTRWNRTTEFCNSPSFAIPDSGPTETNIDINWCFDRI